VHQINPRKLLHSKWTAVTPKNKEKHFLVTKATYDEEGNVTLCLLEAVLTKREQAINWQSLKNSDAWRQGWV